MRLAVFAVRVPGLVAALLAALSVRLCVLCEVVGPHEALVADGTREALLSRVRAKMTLQFVGPCKTLAAEQPVADKRPLTRVPP